MILDKLRSLPDSPLESFALRTIGIFAAAIELLRLLGLAFDLPSAYQSAVVIGMTAWFGWLFRSGIPWDVKALGWRDTQFELDFPPSRLMFYGLDLFLMLATISAVVNLSEAGAFLGALMYGIAYGLGLSKCLVVTRAKVNQWKQDRAVFIGPGGAVYLCLLGGFLTIAGLLISSLSGVGAVPIYGGMLGVTWTLLTLLRKSFLWSR